MSLHKASRRNAALVLSLFLLAALPVTCVRLFPLGRIPPEPAELTAKRADRQKNGFYMLEDLVKTLPAPPLALWGPLKDDPDVVGNYQPEKGSLGQLLGVSRPDDDAKLLKYLDAAQNVATVVSQVLDKPFLLAPPADYEAAEGSLANEHTSFQLSRRLCSLLLGRAWLLSHQPGGSKEAATLIRNALDLADRLHEAGVFDYIWLRDSPIMHTLTRLQPDDQREMLAWLLEVQQRERPSEEAVLNSVRRHMRRLRKYIANNQVQTLGDFIDIFKYRILFSRHHDYALKTARLYRPELDAMADTDAILDKLMSNQYRYCFFDNAIHNMLWDTAINASITVLAIEMFHHDNGAFPISLDELVPKYLPHLPRDPNVLEKTTWVYNASKTGYSIRTQGHAPFHEDGDIFTRKEVQP